MAPIKIETTSSGDESPKDIVETYESEHQIRTLTPVYYCIWLLNLAISIISAEDTTSTSEDSSEDDMSTSESEDTSHPLRHCIVHGMSSSFNIYVTYTHYIIIPPLCYLSNLGKQAFLGFTILMNSALYVFGETQLPCIETMSCAYVTCSTIRNPPSPTMFVN